MLRAQAAKFGDHRCSRVWSLLDLLTFLAHRFVSHTVHLALLSAYFDREVVGEFHRSTPGDIPSDAFYEEVTSKMKALRDDLMALELPVSHKAATRICESLEGGSRLPTLIQDFKDLQLRTNDELETIIFLRVPKSHSVLYSSPLVGWDPVIDRFGCSDDIEESGKCIALGRPTAAVFHLMKVVERGVLEMEVFLNRAPDPKAHFGSVVSKLEDLVQKGKFDQVPDHLRSYLSFMREVLPQLHAVKDAWRDKVSHVGNRIIPVEPFSEEKAMEVYNSTQSLMRKMASGLPPKAQKSS
jgi:hypothetical protein